MEIIKRKLSISDILSILNKKKIKKLSFSRGAFNHLPKRAIKALKKIGVQLEIIDLKRGKPPVVDVKGIEKLADKTAYEISRLTKIPLRTVYYHLKKIKKRRNQHREENKKSE